MAFQGVIGARVKVLLGDDDELAAWNGGSGAITGFYGWLNGEPAYEILLDSGPKLLMGESSLEAE